MLNGRIFGKRYTPVAAAIPKYDTAQGAYMTPDGGAVKVERTGEMTPTDAADAAPRRPSRCQSVKKNDVPVAPKYSVILRCL